MENHIKYIHSKFIDYNCKHSFKFRTNNVRQNWGCGFKLFVKFQMHFILKILYQSFVSAKLINHSYAYKTNFSIYFDK